MALQGPLLDVTEGDQVTIHDGSGAVIAVTQLGPGHIDGGECVWFFQTNVPSGKGFYQARMGRWSSKVIAEADAAGGALTFNLGDNPPSQ